MANLLNIHIASLLGKGPWRKQSSFFPLTCFPLPAKIKIMPGVSNQRLSCCVEVIPIIHTREEKKKKNRHHQSWLSRNTPIRREA